MLVKPRPLKIASTKNLHEIWIHSRDARRGRAAGVDGITPIRFREKLSENLKDINHELIHGTYKFGPLRPIAIPKNDGKSRIICVPTVRDRLVQRLLVEYLIRNNKLDLYNSVSYGFIRNRGGVSAAVKKARQLRQTYPWVFKSDITSFFDQICRNELIDGLSKKLRRSSVLPFIISAVGCEVDNTNNFLYSSVLDAGIVEGRGLRQGMPLSPILSNFVLRDFDHFFEKIGVRLVRYADDFVLFAKTKSECEEFFPLTKEILKKKNHEIPDLVEGSKTIIRAPDEPIDFLGFDI